MVHDEPVPGTRYGTVEHDEHLFEVTGDEHQIPGAVLYVWLTGVRGTFVGVIVGVDSNFPVFKVFDLHLSRENTWNEALRDKAVQVFYEAMVERSLVGVSLSGGFHV